MSAKAILLVAALAGALAWPGCAGKQVRPVPSPIPPVETNPSLSHLLGAWNLPVRGQADREMVFESDGRLVFRGGFEFYNPARWSLDSARRELKITLPEAPEEKLDLFHMYLGEGVKAFDRAHKEVTFAFDAETESLNIAGWNFSKTESLPVIPESEPVLK